MEHPRPLHLFPHEIRVGENILGTLKHGCCEAFKEPEQVMSITSRAVTTHCTTYPFEQGAKFVVVR